MVPIEFDRQNRPIQVFDVAIAFALPIDRQATATAENGITETAAECASDRP